MKAKIIRDVWKSKNPYNGKVSSKTEYKFYIDGEIKHSTRMGRPYGHVAKYKKAMSKKFDVPVDEIEVE